MSPSIDISKLHRMAALARAGKGAPQTPHDQFADWLSAQLIRLEQQFAGFTTKDSLQKSLRTSRTSGPRAR